MEGIARHSYAVNRVCGWARDVSLRINAFKTKAMFFGTSYRVKRLQDSNLPGIDLEDGSLAPFVDEATSLGVVLYSSLTSKPQIDQVTKKVNRAIL